MDGVAVASVSGRGAVAHCPACSSISAGPERCTAPGFYVRGGRRAASTSVRVSSSPPASSRRGFVACRSDFLGCDPVPFLCGFGSAPCLHFRPRLEEGGKSKKGRCGIARSYMEANNPVLKFLSRVQGALPVVGLLSRLASGVGGVGADRLRFQEFCTRVGRNCSREDTKAFYALSARYGKSAKPQFMLIWCWAAAVGAGLLRSEDLLLGASRLRIACDLQFEVENFDLLMDEATQRREQSGSKVPDVPMEFRAEKALEAMCKCCTGTTSIVEEDAPLFVIILKAVFPTVETEQIEDMVASRLFDPLSAAGAVPPAFGNVQPSSDEILSTSSSQREAEIDAVVTSQMLDPLNDDELEEDDDEDSNAEEFQSSRQNPVQSMAQEALQ